MKENFLKIKKEIEKYNNIVLTAHVNPDGDAIGSGLALFISLKKHYKNKNIRFILQDKIPYTTEFLKYSEEIEKYEDSNIDKTELLIFLDSATRERTGLVGEKIKADYTINIDHHISNPNYADMNCVISTMSSASEIVFNFLKENDFEISVEAAEAIYLGIVNDTGNFSHSNVSKSTMEIATQLIGLGVNNNYIVTNFLNSNSFASLKLLGEALKNFEFFEKEKLVYYFLSYETMQKYGSKKEDTEGIVEKILSFYGAEVSLFLREEAPESDKKYKGSMRSKNDIDVNKIANIFSGGGHKKAAGFSSSLEKEEILKEILENL